MSFHNLRALAQASASSGNEQVAAMTFLSLLRPFDPVTMTVINNVEKQDIRDVNPPQSQTQNGVTNVTLSTNLLNQSACLDLSNVFQSVHVLGSTTLLSPSFFNFVSHLLRTHLQLHSIRLPAFPIPSLGFSPQHIFRFYGEILSCIDSASKYSLSLVDVGPTLQEIFSVDTAEWLLHSYVFEALQTLEERIEKRIQRNRERIFGIHGGGNIGIGLLANVVYNSKSIDGATPFHIVATSGDRILRTVVNATDEVCVRHTKKPHTILKNLTLVDRDNANVIELYRNSVVVGISLTPAALQASVAAICQGLLSRYHYDGAHLHILCLFNQPNSDEYVRGVVQKEMEEQCKKQPKLVARVMASVTFHATVVDQIITKKSAEDLKTQMKKMLLEKGIQSLELKTKRTIASLAQNPTPRLSDASTRFYASFAGMKLAQTELNFVRSVGPSPPPGSPLATPRPMPALSTVRSMTLSSRATSPMVTPLLHSNRQLTGGLSHSGIGSSSGPNLNSQSSDEPERATTKLDEEIDNLFMQLTSNSNDAYDELAALVKEHQLSLEFFDAEDSFTFVCSASFPFMSLFPLIRSSFNLAAYELLKNRYFNGPHSVVAWLGALRGHRLIAEAIADEYIGKVVKEMMLKEIMEQLLHEVNEFSAEDYQRFYELFVQRCLALKSDTCLRVGRDPLRKLNKGKRLRGTMEYIQQHKLDIPMQQLELGIAAGILYSLEKKDPENADTQKICELYEEMKGDLEKLLCYKGPASDEEFEGFDAESDKQPLEAVLQQITKLRHECTLFRLARRGLALNNDGQLYYLPSFQPLSVSYDLLFVRHGSTYGNEGQVSSSGDIDMEMVVGADRNTNQRVFQGNVDANINQLTDTGRAQAEGVAERLTEEYFQRGWRPDIIFHSPLSRARDTGMPFVEMHKMHDLYLPLDDLHEMAFGALDNARVCDVPAEHLAHSFYQHQNAEFLFPAGESFCEVVLRAAESLQYLEDAFPEKRILAFSHSMVGAACLILFGKGKHWIQPPQSPMANGTAHADSAEQKEQHGIPLAFDGMDPSGNYYTMPHTTPFPMNFPQPEADDQQPAAESFGVNNSGHANHQTRLLHHNANAKLFPVSYPPNALLNRLPIWQQINPMTGPGSFDPSTQMRRVQENAADNSSNPQTVE